MLEQKISCTCPTTTLTSILFISYLWERVLQVIAATMLQYPTFSHYSEVALSADASFPPFVTTTVQWASGTGKHKLLWKYAFVHAHTQTHKNTKSRSQGLLLSDFHSKLSFPFPPPGFLHHLPNSFSLSQQKYHIYQIYQLCQVYFHTLSQPFSKL